MDKNNESNKNSNKNSKNNNLDKIIKESNIDINLISPITPIAPISRFGCLDFECMISKIKKDDKAYKIFSLYSNLIYQVCKNCDGYHFTCPEYICSADRPRMDIYKSYNKGGRIDGI